jgi:hypothetical protein
MGYLTRPVHDCNTRQTWSLAMSSTPRPQRRPPPRSGEGTRCVGRRTVVRACVLALRPDGVCMRAALPCAAARPGMSRERSRAGGCVCGSGSARSQPGKEEEEAAEVGEMSGPRRECHVRRGVGGGLVCCCWLGFFFFWRTQAAFDTKFMPMHTAHYASQLCALACMRRSGGRLASGRRRRRRRRHHPVATNGANTRPRPLPLPVARRRPAAAPASELECTERGGMGCRVCVQCA